MTNRHLKPCPCCKGKAWFNISAIHCLSCGLRTPKTMNFTDASELWNKRTP